MLTGQLLLGLLVILVAVQGCGYLCRLIGQQWVIGEIMAGLALGPSLLGGLFPGLQAFIFPTSALPTLQTLGDIGLVLYMFSLGARLDTPLMLRQGRIASITSISSILLPLVLGAALGYFLFPSLAGAKTDLISFMLLVGTAMAITAFPVLARLLTEKRLLTTRIGVLALTCAAVGDVIAWCLLSLVIAVIHANGLFSVVLTVGLTLLFILTMLAVVRPLFALVVQRVRSTQLLIALSMMLLLLSAYLTNAIGIHPIFGAFLMGIILPRKTQFMTWIRTIDQVNNVLFLPLFFVYSGLKTQIGLIHSPGLWLICLLVLGVACFGKVLGGALPMRFLGEPWKEALSLGVLMNTRGLIELIVLNIGLSLGVLSPTLFAMLVIMALVTTMLTSPLLPLFGYKQAASQEVSDEVPTAIP